MITHYITFGISICFISWLFAIIANGLFLRTGWYARLSHLNFIQSKRLNKVIGIELIKWVVTKTPFKFFNQSIKLANSKDVDLTVIRHEMTKAEISHLIGFVFVLFFVVYQSIQEDVLLGLVILIFNILMNLYPSLLQQENKRRLDRLLLIRSRRSSQ